MVIEGEIKVNELLPLGSVVTLYGMNHKLMITHYCPKKTKQYIQLGEENNSTYFDYKGILWPEGNINPKMGIMFNHSSIERVDFNGYINKESIKYLNDLETNINKL